MTNRCFLMTAAVLAPLCVSAAELNGPVTFTKDVAPIFQKSCQTCHHAGTSAPMSLLTYDEVRPWAKSIKERVARRDMPPWHLDKTVGIRQYKNDRSLSDNEIATVVKWVDSGAPQGNPADMPKALSFSNDNNDWYIGKPDLLVTTEQDFKMYPSGPDWWIDQFAEVKLTEDRWIKAMEVKPSNAKIVHHAVVYAIEPDAPEGSTGSLLHEFAVGKYGDIFSDNSSHLLRAGTRLRFDMHYFAIGSEQHNKTTIAFKFYPKGFVPKYQVRSIPIRNIPNDELEIPPNSVVRTDGYYRLTRNARIDSFQPHMHMRGRGMTLEAINLDNTTQILSSVDHFNFNWHINYIYDDDYAPLLPAGTVLHMIGIHDNTAANPRNPDPSVWAGFGERSVDDMVQVWLDLVYLDDAEFKRLTDERKTKLVANAAPARRPAPAPQAAQRPAPQTQGSTAGPRLYALDCGLLTIADPSAMFLLKKEEVANTNLADSCFLIKHPKGTLIWDTGVIPDSAFKADGSPVTQGTSTVTKTLRSQLVEVGVKPEEVTYLALSHYHFDHTANANMFAGSTWLVNKAERDAMFVDKTPNLMRAASYSQLKDSKTIYVEKDYDVFGDGTVILKPTPGHTPGHQVLFLKLAKTGPVILGGDLYHYPEEKTLNKIPTIEFDKEQSAASRKKIDEFMKQTGAQLWIGHDLPTNAKLKKSPAFYE